MEFSTTLIWFLAIHGLVAFIVSISIVSCPFRFGNEKLGLLLLTWLLPFIGAIYSHHRIGFLGSASSGSNSGGGTAVDIPPSNSGGCDGGGSSGGCD